MAILLIPMSENHRAAELPRGIHSRIYDASFMNGVYGERINCFRPESVSFLSFQEKLEVLNLTAVYLDRA